MVKSVAILFASFLFVLTAAHYNSNGGRDGGQRGCGMVAQFLLRGIFPNLTDSERQQLWNISQNACNETKADFQSQLDGFAGNLSSDLQQVYQDNKNKMQQFETNITQEVADSSLSDAAKEFISNITSVFENQQITPIEERQQIGQLFQNVNRSILQEIKNSGINLPFGKHGGRRGGSFGQSSSSSQEFNGNGFGRQSGFGQRGNYGGYESFGNNGFGRQGQNSFGRQGQNSFGNNQDSFGQQDGFGRHGGQNGFGQQGFGQQGFGQNGFGKQGGFGQGNQNGY